MEDLATRKTDKSNDNLSTNMEVTKVIPTSSPARSLPGYRYQSEAYWRAWAEARPESAEQVEA